VKVFVDELIFFQEKLVQQGVIDVDQVTRTTVVPPTRLNQDHNTSHSATSNTVVLDGPTLIVESAHPYRHNTAEYSTVQVGTHNKSLQALNLNNSFMLTTNTFFAL